MDSSTRASPAASLGSALDVQIAVPQPSEAKVHAIDLNDLDIGVTYSPPPAAIWDSPLARVHSPGRKSRELKLRSQEELMGYETGTASEPKSRRSSSSRRLSDPPTPQTSSSSASAPASDPPTQTPTQTQTQGTEEGELMLAHFNSARKACSLAC